MTLDLNHRINLPKLDTSQAPCINFPALCSPSHLLLPCLIYCNLSQFVMLLELYQPPPAKLDTYYILGEIA
jgi:hypothetical protein